MITHVRQGAALITLMPRIAYRLFKSINQAKKHVRLGMPTGSVYTLDGRFTTEKKNYDKLRELQRELKRVAVP